MRSGEAATCKARRDARLAIVPKRPRLLSPPAALICPPRGTSAHRETPPKHHVPVSCAGNNAAPPTTHTAPAGARARAFIVRVLLLGSGLRAPAGAVRKSCGSCAGKLRELCGKAAGAMRKSCGSCAEKLRNSCGTAAGAVRKSCGTAAEKHRKSCGTADRPPLSGGAVAAAACGWRVSAAARSLFCLSQNRAARARNAKYGPYSQTQN